MPDFERPGDMTADYICCLHFTRKVNSNTFEKLADTLLKGRHKSTTCGLIVILIKNAEENESESIVKALVKASGKYRQEGIYINLIAVEVRNIDVLI